jgi:hypothetical protein
VSGPCVCVIGRKNGKCWSLRLGRMPKGAHNTPRTKPLGSSTPRATWCVSSLFSVSLLVRCETVESFALVGIGCDCQSLPLLLAMIKHITYKKHIIHQTQKGNGRMGHLVNVHLKRGEKKARTSAMSASFLCSLPSVLLCVFCFA